MYHDTSKVEKRQHSETCEFISSEVTTCSSFVGENCVQKQDNELCIHYFSFLLAPIHNVRCVLQ
jgi:hypothetical protein